MNKSMAVLILVFFAGCSGEAPDSPDTRPGIETLRFAVMTFSHETCTFCPGGDTTIADWTRSRPPYVGDEVLSANSYVRGFVAAANEYQGIELIGLESPAGESDRHQGAYYKCDEIG